ncbi:hypothetical protein Godav_024106, partial [Gossypium davidsonii]|nr:hypothetical protein [Gossypium davidsonii]MBA0665249.1 hypothetical protein [Gossypium klotzschianum]
MDCWIYQEVAMLSFWGILDSLIIIHNRNWDKMSIRTDSMDIIYAIQVAFSRSSNSSIARRNQQMLSSMIQWEIIYTPQEENTKADRITKFTFNRDEGPQLFAEN